MAPVMIQWDTLLGQALLKSTPVNLSFLYLFYLYFIWCVCVCVCVCVFRAEPVAYGGSQAGAWLESEP